jgi:hypothetical protein
VIKTYGKGRATTITDRLEHHAEALLPLASALMNGLLASEVARDGNVHELHLGKGAGGANLYLANGRKFAFRPGFDANGGYAKVEIRDAPKKGTVVAVVAQTEDVPAAIATIEAALGEA